jgi:hypothetical protein
MDAFLPYGRLRRRAPDPDHAGRGAYVWDDKATVTRRSLRPLLRERRPRTELAEAAARQYEELDFFVI